MKVLWVCFLLQLLQVFVESTFGTPYLANSRMCKQWSCINTKLGLPNSLPPREQYDIALRSLLPEGPWQEVVNHVLDTCYGTRNKVYSNTCPGQALLHCTVENLINNCPESSQRKSDACSPLNSFAGLEYMFSQSVFADIDKNAPSDPHPLWYLKNFFNMKCCDLPPLFNTSVLTECKFTSIINYYQHAMHPNNFVLFGSSKTYTTAYPHVATVRIVNPDEYSMTPATASTDDALTVVNPDDNSVEDPLDCCDISGFIQPSWRSECDFKLSWNHQTRLGVRNSMPVSTAPPSTTTTAAPEMLDVKIVPVSSENLTCVFNKLAMLTETGEVKLDLFMKLLDNYTKDHEEFIKAKARVTTECLTKPLLTYDGVSPIEKVVACTFDLLSENCPYYNKKNDTCRNPTAGMVCQISSSRYRAKSRRTQCNLPSLVPNMFLNECGISSLSHMEYIHQKITTFKKYGFTHKKIGCLDSSESTTCLMKKMDILNKYNFMDYFKMKDRIRQYNNESTLSNNAYIVAFNYPSLYKQHCNSPKKLFNVIDSMLMTCPIAKRRTSYFCDEIFAKASYSHFQHNFNSLAVTSKPLKPHPIQYKHKPIYNFGILTSGAIPPVKTIDVNPINPRPVIPVRLPVYMPLRITSLSHHGVASNMLRGNSGSLARSNPNSI